MASSLDMGWEEFFEHYLELQHGAMDHPDHEEAKAASREDRDPEWA